MMAKASGLGANLYIDGVDVSSDTGSVNTISKSLSPLLLTGIDKEANERIAGKLDGRIAGQFWYNPTGAHPTLSDLPRTDSILSYFHRASLNTPVANLVSKRHTYDATRGDDGSLTFDVEALANAYWLDWARSLTAGKRTDGSATNGTGVDFSAGANFGLQAYLHVFAFTGTSVTITLQQSSDNGAGDAFANVTGGSFTVVTAAPFSQRIATARNQAVERYLRVVTTGTFSNAVFAVSAVINRTNLSI
jgi:hypothetical protein